MNWLTKFRSASWSQQLLALSAVFAVVGMILTLIYFSFIRTPYGILFANLRPQDAATILAELDKKKIPYRIENDGSVILAPQDQVSKLRLELMSTDLPLKGTVGFELFNKSDMGLTEFAQQINYQRALQGELARTIMSLADVTDARVHLALPEHTIFAADRQPPKASVILMMREGAVATGGVVKGIQRLVAAAVPDLKVEDVVVLDGRGGVISSSVSPADVAFGGQTDDRSSLEQAYAANIQEALRLSFPDKRFDVDVSIKDGLVSLATSAPPLDSAAANTREFGLHIAITPTTFSDPAAQSAITNVVNATIKAGPNDVVLIHQPPAVEAQGSGEQKQIQKHGIEPTDVRSMILAGGVLLIAFALFGVRRREFGRPMSQSQRRRYAARLQQLLAAES